MSRIDWEKGIAPEIAYWRAWLAQDGEEQRRRLDPDAPMPGYEEYFPSSGGKVRILDVGCGPLTHLGKKAPGWDVEITAVDLLALAYNQVLDQLGLAPPIRPVPGEAERLLEIFSPDTFDFVYCSSTLDHVRDPLGAIEQMLSVVKPTGTVMCVVQMNEGERNNYDGFHNWNFAPRGTDDDERLILWNRAQETDVARWFERAASMTFRWEEVGGSTWITMDWKKRAPGRASLLL
jgi:SAM-dependent methyltransferase